jgi:hypothetical protein
MEFIRFVWLRIRKNGARFCAKIKWTSGLHIMQIISCHLSLVGPFCMLLFHLGTRVILWPSALVDTVCAFLKVGRLFNIWEEVTVSFYLE